MWVYVISVVYFILTLCVFFFTRKKYTGLFHFSLLFGIVPFIIRPILSQVNDGWLIYQPKYQTESDYVIIYLVVILFNLSFILGYLFKMFFFENGIDRISPKIGYIPKVHFIIFMMLLLIGYLFAVGGASWLGNARDTVASEVVPAFRFIYPMVIFLSFFVVLCTFFRVQSKKSEKKELYLVVLLVFACITLLNTRGWFMSILTILFCFYFTKKGLSIKYTIILVVLLGFVAFYMRSILSWIFGDIVEESQTFYQVLLSKFLFTSSGDIIDTWHIVFDYVQDEGYRLGETVLGNFTLLFPTSVRESLSLKPAVDVVNYYYQGDLYYTKKFGFNISIQQEMFINFGYFGLLLIFLSGFFFRYFEAKIFLMKEIKMVTILKMLVYFQISRVMTGLPFISWLIFFYFFYKLFILIYSILPKKRATKSYP